MQESCRQSYLHQVNSGFRRRAPFACATRSAAHQTAAQRIAATVSPSKLRTGQNQFAQQRQYPLPIAADAGRASPAKTTEQLLPGLASDRQKAAKPAVNRGLQVVFGSKSWLPLDKDFGQPGCPRNSVMGAAWRICQNHSVSKLSNVVNAACLDQSEVRHYDGLVFPQASCVTWNRTGNFVRGKTPEAEAAPATVSGEPAPTLPLDPRLVREGGQRHRPAMA